MGRVIEAGLLFFSATFGACETGPPAALDPTFDNLFPEFARLSLEELPDDPLAEITSLRPLSNGGFVVVDGQSDRVREYGSTGRLRRTLGSSGDGPGELRQPTDAVEGPEGELHVIERGSPRHTVFWSADSVTTTELPGLYGFWLQETDIGLVAGVGTPRERFASLSYDGDLIARFALRKPEIQETPFWVFFVRERATALGDRIYINESFSPTIRVFSPSGDSLHAFGTTPQNWIDPTHPGIATISNPADRERIEAWARSFSVVTDIAATDSVLIVQYGRHNPSPTDSYHLVRKNADVYSMNGRKIVEGLELSKRILSGGEGIYVLEAEPPNPWTISVRRWSGGMR